MEILHKKKIAEILSHTRYQEGHAPLMKALRSAYPGWEINLAADHGEWHSVGNKLLFPDGEVVSDDFDVWLRAEYGAAGQDAKAVWEKYRDAGMVLTEWRGHTIYITVPYGPEPDAFFQVEIEARREVTGHYAFDNSPRSKPADLSDLIHSVTDLVPEREISPWRYDFQHVVDVRRFVRDMVAIYQAERKAMLPEISEKMIHIVNIDEARQASTKAIPFLDIHPDWLTWKHPCARLFRDWQESSAGQSGHRFCDHWYFSTNDYTDSDGKRHLSVIPRWADKYRACDLPEIHPGKEASYIDVFSMLRDFDEQAGHDFAWYFFMLHGGKINAKAGLSVAQGIANCSIWMPEKDERVLMRWYGRQYGF